MPELVLRPGQRLERYTLIERLATGGMAEVWLARHTGPSDFSRLVAIKRVLSHLARDPIFVRMFLHEARTAARLAHPNIVQILDLGQHDGLYYLAMEYVAGQSLAAIARRARRTGRPLPTPLLARIIADAAAGLHYAHQLRGTDGAPLGLVHRDVSPQNVLVSYEGATKIVDFGIAKAATSERTDSGVIKGKFNYLSPEQAEGAPIDARSDVFALGILLWELSTGARLFQHESELMLLNLIAQQPIRPPSELVPSLSPALERIILRALARAPEERYPSAEALRLDLEQYLASEAPGTHSGLLAHWMSDAFPEAQTEDRHQLLTRPAGDAPTVRHPAPGRLLTTPPRARPTPGALVPHRAPPTPGTIVPPRARPTPRPAAPPRARGTPTQALPKARRAPTILVIVAAVLMSAAALSVLWNSWHTAPPSAPLLSPGPK